MTVIVAFVLGLLAGVIPKGIHVSIIHKHEQPEQQPKKQEYNESMAKHLPAEVQQYYHETNGQNRF